VDSVLNMCTLLIGVLVGAVLCCALQAPIAAGWKGTAMEPHINYFADSFLASLTASSKSALNDRAKQAAADQRVQQDVSW
jgi:hypothetical protein